MVEPEISHEDKRNESRQWSAFRFFYESSGNKYRLRSKVFLWGILACFSVALVIGLIQGPDNPQKSESREPIAAVKTNVNGTEVSSRRSAAGTTRKMKSEFADFQKIAPGELTKIPPGSIGKAILVTGASDGPVRAKLTEDLQLNGNILLERETTLLGKGASTEERLSIVFTTAVGPDGKSKRIEAEACDSSDEMPGLVGSNVRGKSAMLLGSLALGALGGYTRSLQSYGQESTSAKQATLNGVSGSTLQEASNLADDYKNTEPLFEVKKGTKLIVIFTGEET